MKTFTVLFLTTLALLTGCAGNQISGLQRQLAQQQAQITKLEQTKRDLVLKMAGTQKLQEAAVTTAVAAAPPAGYASANPMTMAVPPPSRPEQAIPDNWAWLNAPPMGCGSATLLELKNESQYYWQLAVNERDMIIGSRDGQLPNLPPGATVFICLPDTGMQNIVGVGYLLRFGVPREAVRFNFYNTFGDRFNPFIGHQKAAITDNTPRFNQLRILS